MAFGRGDPKIGTTSIKYYIRKPIDYIFHRIFNHLLLIF